MSVLVLNAVGLDSLVRCEVFTSLLSECVRTFLFGFLSVSSNLNSCVSCCLSSCCRRSFGLGTEIGLDFWPLKLKFRRERIAFFWPTRSCQRFPTLVLQNHTISVCLCSNVPVRNKVKQEKSTQRKLIFVPVISLCVQQCDCFALRCVTDHTSGNKIQNTSVVSMASPS